MESTNLKRLVHLFPITLLAACQAAQPTPQAQTNFSEQPTAAQPSAPAPTSQSSLGLCDNPYWPVVEGATWTSSYHTSQQDDTQVDTITDVGSDAFLIETTRSNADYVITWTCTPEGLLWLQTNGGMFSAVFPNQQWSTNSYTGVSIPKQINPGDTWSSSESLTATGSDGSMTFDIHLDFRAVGKESISVPAGTFDAMRLDIVMEFVGPGFDVTVDISDWAAENVGMVKSVAQSDTGGLDWEMELVSYSIP
ncbi:MAG TPA: hypothetical protein VLD63_12955 [Anaerolineales bacterium]|nr:hypothetical protein [Anaerolineales bacterium]